MSIIQGNAHTSAGGGYQIERSLRFNPADTAYLNRTLGSSNRRTFTFSAWVKRSLLASDQHLLGCIDLTGGNNRQFGIVLQGGDYLTVFHYNNGTYQYYPTAALYRDTSAWYHFVVAVDTTQATGSNRAKIYVNGVLQATNGAVDFTQNTDLFVNSGLNTGIGVQVGTGTGNSYHFGGYLTEVNFIDGQALTPSSFGETDSATGVWKPKAYSGTYGTNGFYLKFADNSGTTSTTLGKDSSGNGNNWTPNNFSVTAGAGNDSMVDSPTAYGTDTGAGGSVRGNYCTLNPLAKDADVTLANGNLDFSCTSAGLGGAIGTIAVSSGKWYWEVTVTGGTASAVGVAKLPLSAYDANQTGTYLYLPSGDKRLSPSTDSAYGASFTTNDVIGVALDMDAGTVTFYKNNSSQGTAFSSLSGDFTAWLQDGTSGSASTFVTNFGQRAFAYTAPSGFKALCTTNLPTPTIGATSTTLAGKYFNPVLYTGTGVARSVTGVGFQPDFVWIKKRSGAESHVLSDAIRGTNNFLSSNSTASENTASGTLTAFNSDGFSLGTQGIVNDNTFTFVSWNWNAGGSTVTNTSGTITSTVRANTTSGFSIVTYTGTGSAATVGHGLGVAPSMIIVKERSPAGDNWQVYHASVVSLANGKQWLALNTTDSLQTNGSATTFTSASSTTFGIGNSGALNGSTQTYVAYCFAPVAGYSAFGSYTGNGSSDGVFVYTGFRPRFILFKESSASGNDWYIFDSVRSTYNVATNRLFPNSSAAEATNFNTLDILSNGWKLRDSNSAWNGSGATYIYMALAESPFKYSLGR